MEVFTLLHLIRLKRLKGYIKRLDGLVAYWPLWEQSGTVARNYAPDTFGSLNATMSGGVTLGMTGQAGKAFSFDGNDDRISGGAGSNALNITGNKLTMIIHMNLSAVGASWSTFFSKGTKWGFKWDNSVPKKIYYYINDGVEQAATSTNDYTLNSWQQLVLVYDGSLPSGNLILYVNGAADGSSKNATGNIVDTSANNLIIPVSTTAITGLVQHVAVLDRVLSANEVLKLAQIAGL